MLTYRLHEQTRVQKRHNFNIICNRNYKTVMLPLIIHMQIQYLRYNLKKYMHLCMENNNELQLNKYCAQKSINFKPYNYNKMQWKSILIAKAA